MWGALLRIGIGLILYVGYELLRPRDPIPEPAGKDELGVPRATEGDEIGFVYGTEWIKSPQVAWFGDYKTKPVRAGGKKGGK